jgi:predicted nucleic acid-binding protein
MRFWDASAVVPLIINDVAAAPPIGADAKSPMVVWWGTVIEVASAIARLERAGTLSGEQVMRCLDLLQELSTVWLEVLPSDSLRRTAQRLLRVHALKAADSLQLAAALAASADRSGSFDFICRDSRLSEAAAREGLRVRAA